MLEAGDLSEVQAGPAEKPAEDRFGILGEEPPIVEINARRVSALDRVVVDRAVGAARAISGAERVRSDLQELDVGVDVAAALDRRAAVGDDRPVTRTDVAL